MLEAATLCITVEAYHSVPLPMAAQEVKQALQQLAQLQLKVQP